MPLVKIQTSESVDQATQEELLMAVSRKASAVFEKPERAFMCSIDGGVFLMSGQPGPAAYVDVRGIGGFSRERNVEMVSQLCALLDAQLGIPSNRVYVTFTDVSADMWGTDNRTIG